MQLVMLCCAIATALVFARPEQKAAEFEKVIAKTQRFMRQYACAGNRLSGLT